jgi:molecular chaperone HtpG
MTVEPEPDDSQVALGHLVHQFSEPLAFLRELVQNSLDAGSPEIDIRCEFQPPAPDSPDAPDTPDAPGVSIIHVRDYGRGMDREIIDTRFTRLFHATAEQDLEGFGHLGIGFVSVFALRPDAVCVDTSRGGESWRILFQRDQSFHCIPRDEPGVGTHIQVFRTAKEADHEATVARAREVLATWCRHCTAEIRFAGELINEPLDVDALCSVRHTDDDLEVVVGYPRDERPFYGFYRHGLTIHETREGYWDDVVFKIDARSLSHSLSRDDVLHDDTFHRTMERVARLIQDDLPATLLGRIEAQLQADETDAGDETNAGDELLDRYYRIGAEVIGQRRGRWPRSTDSRVIFRTVQGREVTVREFQESADKGRVYFDQTPSPLTDAMVDEGQLVVRAAKTSAALHALESWLGVPPRPAHAWFCKPVPARSDDEAERWVSLRRAMWRLLQGDDNPITEVEVAHFSRDRIDHPQRAAITQTVFGELTAFASVKAVESTPPDDPCTLVINADHPVVEPLFHLATGEPELAVCLLLRLLGQQQLVQDALERKFTISALAQRDRRLGETP